MCFSVAAGVSPAVEPGILPGGTSPRIPQNVAYFQIAEQPGVVSGRQDAALYGSQDGRRYATKHVRRRTIAHGVSRGGTSFLSPLRSSEPLHSKLRGPFNRFLRCLTDHRCSR